MSRPQRVPGVAGGLGGILRTGDTPSPGWGRRATDGYMEEWGDVADDIVRAPLLSGRLPHASHDTDLGRGPT